MEAPSHLEICRGKAPFGMGHQTKSYLIVVDTDVGMMPRLLRDSSHCLNKINCLQEGLEFESSADFGSPLVPA